MSALLLPTVLLASTLAPAPFPRSPDTRAIEALSRDAEAASADASRLNQRLLLGESLPAQERADLRRQHRAALRRAAEQYGRLARLLDALRGSTQDLRKRASSAHFKEARCLFSLGQYAEALAVYERLIDKFKGKAEALDALGGAASCHSALGQPDKVRQRLTQIEKALGDLPQEARAPWQAWLKEASRALTGG